MTEKLDAELAIAHIKGIAVPGDYPESHRLRSWKRVEELARLGAAVEAMPKTLSLENRGTAGYLSGAAWDVNGPDDDQYVTALTPMEALRKASNMPWWQKALETYGT